MLLYILRYVVWINMILIIKVTIAVAAIAGAVCITIPPILFAVGVMGEKMTASKMVGTVFILGGAVLIAMGKDEPTTNATNQSWNGSTSSGRADDPVTAEEGEPVSTFMLVISFALEAFAFGGNTITNTYACKYVKSNQTRNELMSFGGWIALLATAPILFASTRAAAAAASQDGVSVAPLAGSGESGDGALADPVIASAMDQIDLVGFWASAGTMTLMGVGGSGAYVALAAGGAQGTVLAPLCNAYLIVPIIVGSALGETIPTVTAIGMAVILLGVPIISLQKKEAHESQGGKRRLSLLGM